MPDSLAGLRRKIDAAADLQSVVRAMKAQSAAGIGRYERSVAALADYARSVELGLTVCFRQGRPVTPPPPRRRRPGDAAVRAIVFGSDQGLVGRFNDVIVDHARESLAAMDGHAQVWAVGERARAGLAANGLALLGVFAVPGSAGAITGRVAQILVTVLAASDTDEAPGAGAELHLFHNRPTSGAGYAPVRQRLLPLDAAWQRGLARRAWPTVALPEVVGRTATTVRALIGEYLFVSIFRACAESLASENASRLASMERADRNIDRMRATLDERYHRLRQATIDAELSDVIAGFTALRRGPARD